MDLNAILVVAITMGVATIYSVLAWKLSGETFNETKFWRTLVVAGVMAFGIDMVNIPEVAVYISPTASTLVGTIFSKYLGYRSREEVAKLQADISDLQTKIQQVTDNPVINEPGPTEEPKPIIQINTGIQ